MPCSILSFFCAPHHCLLATCPKLKQILCPSTFWKLEVFLFPSADSLKGQSSKGQYRFPMHLPTFLVPIRFFHFKECILKYLRSWFFWAHSLGKHLNLYIFGPSISCDRSSTHSGAMFTISEWGIATHYYSCYMEPFLVAEWLSHWNHVLD